MLKIRTQKDNPQLAPQQTQFEFVVGAVSTEVLKGSVVRITTVRGIPSRKAQYADLDAEALDAFILELRSIRESLGS